MFSLFLFLMQFFCFSTTIGRKFYVNDGKVLVAGELQQFFYFPATTVPLNVSLPLTFLDDACEHVTISEV